MAYIKNRDQLLAHGNTGARRPVLDIIEHALAQADPYQATCRRVRRKGDTLWVDQLRFDLNQHGHIFLLGAGKATFPIAKALEDILGDRITDGVVIAKYRQPGSLTRCRLYLASHPIPDEAGHAAAHEALALAQQVRPGDIVFGCVTGGSSALLPYPVEGVTLEEKKTVNRLLLTCGANIIEINAVRKHLSQVKGGRLAQAIDPEAHLINLTVSDVIGDPLDYITDPTVPDTSTFADARATLTKYGLWEQVPPAVAAYLKNAGALQETPKAEDLADYQRHDFIIVAGDAACEAAAAKAEELGFETIILSTMLEGESRELGGTFAAVAREIALNRRPLNPPCVLIGGGETTVKVEDQVGQGGPNQEFALGAALGIDAIGNVVVAGIDSDGTDGPTETAGGIADDQTIGRAREKGLEVFTSLMAHDVTPALKTLGDAVETGTTGTNVNDLKIMAIFP